MYLRTTCAGAPMRDHSSAGRAPALQAGGHRFEPYWSHFMGEFPSGQRGQTVNLLAMPSVVRIHFPPFFFFIITRGRAVRKLVGLITRRSQVQILSPLLTVFILFAQVAQLVEQRTENPRVAGSIPALGIFYWFF